jgi:hypothetical protein
MASGRTIGFFFGLSRATQAIAAFALLLVALAAPSAPSLAAPSDPTPLKTTVAVTVNDGYARLVFTAGEYLDATARVAGNVLIINFKEPVDVSVDRIAERASDYIGAARRDPDGKAVRMALAQTVTVNTMAAGEKLFVDLLPASWTGVPPGLPQDVVDDLARRAREAEQALQHEQHVAQQKKPALIRVHVASQPTFTRYIFAVPAETAVKPDRSKDRLVLNFDVPLNFDLADADAALSGGVQEISSELDSDTSLVRFLVDAKVNVRTFRDESGYVVDIVSAGANASQPGQQSQPIAAAQPGPQTVPAVVPAAAPSSESGHDDAASPPLAPNIEAPATIAAPMPQQAVQGAPQPAPVAAPDASAAPPPAPPVAAVVAAPAAAAPPPAPVAAPVAAPAAAGPQPSPTMAAPTPPAAANTPAPPPSADAAQKSSDAAPPHPATPIQTQSDGKIAQEDAKAAQADAKVAAELVHQGANLKLSFPFKILAAAAVFHRADMLWIVFDSKLAIDLSALDGESSRTIRGYQFTQSDGADIVRLQLDRPHLSGVHSDGAMWTVEIGDSVLEPSHALDITRNLIGANRSSVTIPFDGPQALHRLADPEAGDTLFVVTGFAPARGFIDSQDFVEFDALASTQGAVIEPIADDITVQLAPDKIVVGRPNGLTLSTSLQTLLHGSGLRPVMFDSQIWGFDRQASYIERQSHLIAAAAAAPDNQRLVPRLDLARFYLARDMYPEAKGVLDVALTAGRRRKPFRPWCCAPSPK